MTAYPALAQGFDTSRTVLSGLAVSPPGQGGLAAETHYGAPLVQVRLVHPALTLAEAAQVEDFFAAYAYAEFDLVLDDADESLAARFLAPPDVQPIEGNPGWRRVEVALLARSA